MVMVLEQTDGFRVSQDGNDVDIVYLKKSSGWTRTLVEEIADRLFQEPANDRYYEGYEVGYEAGLQENE